MLYQQAISIPKGIGKEIEGLTRLILKDLVGN
jgi:hypothetical protein